MISSIPFYSQKCFLDRFEICTKNCEAFENISSVTCLSNLRCKVVRLKFMNNSVESIRFQIVLKIGFGKMKCRFKWKKHEQWDQYYKPNLVVIQLP